MLEEKREKYMNEEVIYDLSDIREIFDRCVKENEIPNARAEGREEGHREIAYELLQENLSLDFISKVTKLSIEEIEEMKCTIV